MAGINLDADLGVRGFLKGTKDMEEALDDVSDALEDTAKAGDDGVDKLSDKLKEAKRAADEAAESGKNLGKDFKKGTDEASEGTKTLKENADSNAKEVAASFDGSVESIVDGFQGLAAEAFEGFGTAGLIAGAALAAGIGLATAEFQRSEEAAKAAKERVAELGIAFIESGADTAQVEAFSEALQAIITNADDAAVKIDDLRKFTERYGKGVTDVSSMAMAYAGNADAIEQVNEQLEAAIQAEKDKEAATKAGAERSKEKIEAYQGEIDKLEKIQEEAALAAQIEKDWLASGGAEALAKADAIDQINSAYDEAVYAVDNFKNAETGIYDLDAYAQSIRDREKLLQDYQTSLAESGLTTDQKAALNEMGVEQAQAILNGLKDPNTSQATKETIKKGLKTASQEGSGVAKKEIEDAFSKPVKAKVDVSADTSRAQADLDKLIQARTAIIKLDFQDRYGKRVY